MTFIGTIDPEQATGEVAELYERQRNGHPYLPNYARVFCYRPRVMKAWAELQRELRREMDARTFGLVTLASALAIGNSYCALAHARKLIERYFSEEEMLAIVRGDEDGPLTRGERAMMAFAAGVAGDSGAITATDVALLRAEGFSDEQVFDITAVAAGRCFFSKIPDALGVQPDASFGELPAPLRELLVVGRPIAQDGPAQSDHT